MQQSIIDLIEAKRCGSDTVNIWQSVVDIGYGEVSVYWQGYKVVVERMDEDSICASVIDEDGIELDGILLCCENDSDKDAWVGRLFEWVDLTISNGKD